MHLPNASEEQLEVINSINTSNVLVDSVAGSGKTVTVLHIGSTYKVSTLLLTYNRRLKSETKQKAKDLGLTHVEVHSYHAFCCKYYSFECCKDNGIINVLKKNTKRKKDFEYVHLILDEAQDVTPTYYELVFKIIKDNSKKIPTMCILGDRFQSIFGFNNADARFIIYATTLFNINYLGWKTTKLSTSFRLTKENADFLNNCVLDEDRIKTVKNGPKPRYIICDCFGDKLGLSGADRPYEEVMHYLKKYNCEDMFILAPSVKSEKSPVRQLANKLSNNNIAIYVPNSDEEKLDDDVIKGKVVFSTFHQTKGLERKVVIVFGFDSSYFRLFKRDNNPNVCPNEIYVACTRAIDCLTILHHYDNDYFKFLQVDKLRTYCHFEENIHMTPREVDRKVFEASVTDLLRHIPSTVLETALGFINYKVINEKEDIVEIDIKSQQAELWENVSDITGVAIPSYFELKHTSSMTIWNCLCKQPKQQPITAINNNEYMFLDETKQEPEVNKFDLSTIDIYNLTTPQLLYVSNEYCSYRSGYIYKLNQIKDYTWLSEENLKICCSRLEKVISKEAIFEKELSLSNEKELFNRKLKGVIDCVDGNKIYEFKCVQELQPEHILQLAIYAYMNEVILLNKIKENEALITKVVNTYKFRRMEQIYIKYQDSIQLAYVVAVHAINNTMTVKVDNQIVKINKNQIHSCANLLKQVDSLLKEQDELCKYKNKYRYFLFNILDNEIIEVTAQTENLRALVHYIVYNKYFNTHKLTDKQFINSMKKLVKKYNLLQEKCSLETQVRFAEQEYSKLTQKINETDLQYSRLFAISSSTDTSDCSASSGHKCSA